MGKDRWPKVLSNLAWFVFMTFGAQGLVGCIVVEDTPDTTYTPQPVYDYSPNISDTRVEVGFDEYYGECYWNFFAWVDDADGYGDVSNVFVDVLDYYSNVGQVTETFNLAYDGNGQWSDTIYLTYAGTADCYYPEYYGFEFYAYDYDGAYDHLSIAPELPDNSPPYFTNAEVYADYDAYYAQCFWDFYAWVEDADGDQDVVDVYVDVIDLYDLGYVVETFPLAYDGVGQWSDLIYQQYAGAADCNYPDDYGYDFCVYDAYGAYDVWSF